MSDDLIGKTGRMIARATDQVMGEVMVSVGSGTETFFAFAAGTGAEVADGTQVLIIDHAAGRTVYVTPQ